MKLAPMKALDDTARARPLALSDDMPPNPAEDAGAVIPLAAPNSPVTVRLDAVSAYAADMASGGGGRGVIGSGREKAKADEHVRSLWRGGFMRRRP